MTLRIKIEVPADGGPYEAQVAESNGNPARVLTPGECVEIYVHSGNQITVTELPAGTKAALDAIAPAGDFLADKQACGIAGEPCDACQ